MYRLADSSPFGYPHPFPIRILTAALLLLFYFSIPFVHQALNFLRLLVFSLCSFHYLHCRTFVFVVTYSIAIFFPPHRSTFVTFPYNILSLPQIQKSPGSERCSAK